MSCSDDDLDDSRDVFTPTEYLNTSCIYYSLTAALDIHGDGNGIASIQKVEVTNGGSQKNQGENVHFGQRTPTEKLRGLATMSVFEHKTYLELRDKYVLNQKPLQTAADYQDFLVLGELEQKVESERKKVNEYLYSNACTTRRKDYFFIHPEAKPYVAAILKEELTYCLGYERFYSAEKIISLLLPGIQVKDTPFSFIKVILKLGHIPPLIIPTTSRHCVIHAECDVLSKTFPPCDVGSDSVHPSKQHIAKDTIATDLAVKYRADAVITLDSLKMLMDNVHPHYENSWEIPVVVCECEDPSGGDPLKCIYIEKAIPTSSLSIRSKNELYYSYALRFRFCHVPPVKSRKSYYHFPSIPQDFKPVSEEIQAEVDKKISDLTSFEDVFESSEKVCELDTFGVSSPKKQVNSAKISSEEQNALFMLSPKKQPSRPEVSSEEQTTIHGKNQTIVNSRSCSDDDEWEDDECDTMLDEELLSNIKGMLMNPHRSQKAEGETTSDVEATKVSKVDKKEEEGKKNDNLLQCMSPASNADSEQGGLIIDCDSEEKQPDSLALSTLENEPSSLDKMCDNGDLLGHLEQCSLQKNENSVSDAESEIIGKRKKKKRMKLSSDEDDSDHRTVPHTESKDKTVISGESHELPGSESSKAQKNSSENAVGSPPVGILDDILMSQHKMFNPENKDDDAEKIMPSQFANADLLEEIRKSYPPLSPHENVQYSLWRLGDLKLVLRSEVDSQLNETGRPAIPAFLFPKLEYQVKFGYEITTSSETIRQWLVLHTHPGSRIVKVHINVPETKLSLLEEVSPAKLRNHMKEFNPQLPTHQLYTILCTLKSLPEGQYLLSHKKNEAVLVLQKAVDEAKHGAYDLHSSIKQRLESVDKWEDEDPSVKDVPWLPIDATMALPEQVRQQRIPGCFFPTDLKKKRMQRKLANNLQKNKT